MAAGDHAEVVPVAAALVGGDVAVGQVEVLRAVVVQVAELRAPAPAAEVDAEARRQVLVRRAWPSPLGLRRHPEVVALHEHARLGDVGHVDGETAVVEQSPNEAFMPLFGRHADAGLASPTSSNRLPALVAQNSETP